MRSIPFLDIRQSCLAILNSIRLRFDQNRRHWHSDRIRLKSAAEYLTDFSCFIVDRERKSTKTAYLQKLEKTSRRVEFFKILNHMIKANSILKTFKAKLFGVRKRSFCDCRMWSMIRLVNLLFVEYLVIVNSARVHSLSSTQWLLSCKHGHPLSCHIHRPCTLHGKLV